MPSGLDVKRYEKDFRDDPWRLAYNAFMCGFGRGIAVNKQEQPEVDLEEEITKWIEAGDITDTRFDDYDDSDIERTARHFYEFGQSNQYQKDRAEFAKLKAKEWQEGYDEGYAKGLNAREEN